MDIKFTKMQGTGNDFVMVNGLEYNIKNYQKTAKKLCDRHFGIGGDGLIIILPPDENDNDYKMRIFNADGSEAEMCGNGIRCFAHYIKENKLTDKKGLRVETLAGIIKPEIVEDNENWSQVKVNMGQPAFDPQQIPINLNFETDFVEDYELLVDEKLIDINCVSMGNPHSIIFVESVGNIEVAEMGKKIENHDIFPEKTNVEFIEIVNPSEIIMRVWERGSGITLACGTGACASAVAGIKKDLLNQKVTTHLLGGDLVIEWGGDGEDVIMAGSATTVFNGSITI